MLIGLHRCNLTIRKWRGKPLLKYGPSWTLIFLRLYSITIFQLETLKRAHTRIALRSVYYIIFFPQKIPFWLNPHDKWHSSNSLHFAIDWHNFCWHNINIGNSTSPLIWTQWNLRLYGYPYELWVTHTCRAANLFEHEKAHILSYRLLIFFHTFAYSIRQIEIVFNKRSINQQSNHTHNG